MSTKDEYIRKMHSRLDQLNSEIDRLVARKDQLQEAGHSEFNKQMEELRHRREDAMEKLKQLQGASESAWGDIKSGIEMAWEALAQATESARSRFK
jgi:uncharacterized coiled-coil DUF342 family protein